MHVRDHLKVTTVVVTHDMRTARRVGNRVLMMHDNTIYAAGAPEEFFASQDPVVRQFVDGVADAKKLNHGKVTPGNQSRPVCARRAGAAGRAADPIQQGHEHFPRHLRIAPACEQRRRPQATRLGVAGRRAGRQRLGHRTGAGWQKRDHFPANLQNRQNLPRRAVRHSAIRLSRRPVRRNHSHGQPSCRCWSNGADVECEAPFNLQEIARAAAGFIQRIDETAKKLDAAVTRRAPSGVERTDA